MLLAELLQQAQQHGRVHAGVSAADVSVALWAIGGVVETSAAVDPGAWERHLDLVLAGMAAADPGFSRPPLSPQQLDGITCRPPAASARAGGL